MLGMLPGNMTKTRLQGCGRSHAKELAFALVPAFIEATTFNTQLRGYSSPCHEFACYGTAAVFAQLLTPENSFDGNGNNLRRCKDKTDLDDP
jgi:hypothetical protein